MRRVQTTLYIPATLLCGLLCLGAARADDAPQPDAQTPRSAAAPEAPDTPVDDGDAAAADAPIAPPPPEPDPAPVLDSIFGEELARVAKTPAVSDDVALARRMLEASDAAGDRPKLAALLCERAAGLCERDPSSVDLAVACMERVMAMAPERGVELAPRIVDLRQRQYSAARGDDRKTAADVYLRAGLDAVELLDQAGQVDAALQLARQLSRVPAGSDASSSREQIETLIRQLAAKQLTLSQIARLKQQLKANPSDQASAQKLIQLYVVELDNPGEAFKYSMLLTDEKTKANVKTASRDMQFVEPLEAFDAGQWYRTLAAASKEPATRLAMLARAADLLDRFIESEPSDALLLSRARDDRAKVAEEVDRIEKSIARQTGADWVDLKPRADWKTAGFTGRNGVYQCGVGEGRVLAVAFRPTGAYEYRVQLARLSGPGHVGLIFTLPSGESASCTFVAQGANGNKAGFHLVDHRTYQANPTSVAGSLLPQGRKVTLRVVVEPQGDLVKVTGYIGNTVVTRYSGPMRRLSSGGDWRTESGSLGVLADLASIAVFSVEYRTLSR